jgi:hypothetical protein
MTGPSALRDSGRRREQRALHVIEITSVTNFLRCVMYCCGGFTVQKGGVLPATALSMSGRRSWGLSWNSDHRGALCEIEEGPGEWAVVLARADPARCSQSLSYINDKAVKQSSLRLSFESDSDSGLLKSLQA